MKLKKIGRETHEENTMLGPQLSKLMHGGQERNSLLLRLWWARLMYVSKGFVGVWGVCWRGMFLVKRVEFMTGRASPLPRTQRVEFMTGRACPLPRTQGSITFISLRRAQQLSRIHNSHCMLKNSQQNIVTERFPSILCYLTVCLLFCLISAGYQSQIPNIL